MTQKLRYFLEEGFVKPYYYCAHKCKISVVGMDREVVMKEWNVDPLTLDEIMHYGKEVPSEDMAIEHIMADQYMYDLMSADLLTGGL